MTTRPPLSATWEALGESAFYRKDEVYALAWDLGSKADLDNFLVAAGPYGGPLALLRDPKKPVIAGKQTIGRPKIQVYSSAGLPLATVSWDGQAKIVGFGFTLNDSLAVVGQDGNYRLYQLAKDGGYTQHTLGSEAAENGVLQVKIYDTGMVVFLANYTFLELKLWPEEDLSIDPSEFSSDDNPLPTGNVIRLADIVLNQLPSSWAVVPPEVSSSRQVEVVISAHDTVLLLDALDCQDVHINNRGAFDHIEPSPNGRFIAFVGSSYLTVMPSDFSRTLTEYNFAHLGDPRQVAWCGSNSVLLAFDGQLLMVGPSGEELVFEYNGSLHLVNEIDSARVFTIDRCELLQKVADSTLNIFKPGSATPAAILFEATEAFDRKSPKADESMRGIRADLVEAVDICIDAAGREFDVYWQRKLLKAASFGKAFLDLYNPSDFVAMTQNLRVLNAVRHYEVGMPLSLDQFRAHAPPYLVARLTLRSLHLLASKIAAFLNISQARVLKHWAESKVAEAKTSQDEQLVCRDIIRRLQGQAHVSCADIARTAWEKGQTGLAGMLLEYEPKASKQVSLLLSMKNEKVALSKALDSSDPDLAYMVLMRMIKSQGPASFYRSIDDKPDAIALFQKWAKDQAVELLRDFNYQDDRRTESACLVLDESLGTTDPSEQISKIKEAHKFFSDDRERQFETKMVDEHLRLAALQQSLQKDADSRRHFIGLSLHETIRQCILAGWPKKADKIKSDWKVPDKRFWWIKLKALTESRDWEGLEAFARSKKSPIGYEPFVEHLVSHGSMQQALLFVPRCEPRMRAEMYVKCGDWTKAGEECRNSGDRNRLMDLRSRAPNNIIAAQLDAMLESMQNSF